MINKKKRTMLLMLSTLLLVGGAIVFALSRSEDENVEQGQKHDASVSSGKPSTEFEFLTRRVRKDGLKKVRPTFAKLVAHHLSQIKYAQERPYGDKIQAASRAALQTMSWVECWSLTESHAIYNGEPVPEDFDAAIWKPMIVALKEARPEYLKALKKMEESREERVIILNTKTGKKEIDSKKLKLFKRNLERMRIYSDSSVFFLELARLAKVAKRPDLVKEVFNAYHDKMITRNYYGRKSRKKVIFASAKQFLAFDHKAIFKELYGKRVELVPKPLSPPLPKNVITEAEKTAIRKFHHEVNKAIITQDRKKLIGFFWNPSKEAIALLDKLLKKETIHSIDISKTKYQFFRAKPKGAITVNSSNYLIESTSHRAGSKPQKVTTAWNVKVIFVNENPKIIFHERKK